MTTVMFPLIVNPADNGAVIHQSQLFPLPAWKSHGGAVEVGVMASDVPEAFAVVEARRYV
jgi:hypothetical protein